MRLFFSIGFWVIVSASSVGQTGVVEIVEQSQYASDTSAPYFYPMGFTLLYQDTVLEEKYRRKPGIIYFDHLLPGHYTLRYNTIFQQVFTQEFIHDGHSVQRRSFYYDKFQEDPAQFAQLEHLKPGDSLIIQQEGWGCEPHDGGLLTFIKRKHHRVDARFVQNGKAWSTRSLTPVQVHAAVTLERQLRSLGSAGMAASTQHDDYSIRQHGVEIFSLLFAEEWDGMERFRSFIFGL